MTFLGFVIFFVLEIVSKLNETLLLAPTINYYLV